MKWRDHLSEHFHAEDCWLPGVHGPAGECNVTEQPIWFGVLLVASL